MTAELAAAASSAGDWADSMHGMSIPRAFTNKFVCDGDFMNSYFICLGCTTVHNNDVIAYMHCLLTAYSASGSNFMVTISQ